MKNKFAEQWDLLKGISHGITGAPTKKHENKIEIKKTLEAENNKNLPIEYNADLGKHGLNTHHGPVCVKYIQTKINENFLNVALTGVKKLAPHVQSAGTILMYGMPILSTIVAGGTAILNSIKYNFTSCESLSDPYQKQQCILEEKTKVNKEKLKELMNQKELCAELNNETDKSICVEKINMFIDKLNSKMNGIDTYQ